MLRDSEESGLLKYVVAKARKIESGIPMDETEALAENRNSLEDSK